jgi:adenosine deaminase CECR1
VRDTLLLGATRIGHALNLTSDPDTLLLMRNNGYLIETSLISNQLLG